MSHYSEKHYPSDDAFDAFHYALFFRKGEQILDVGCSTGNFIAQDPANITGVDVDRDGVAAARKRGFNAVLQNNPKRLPFKDGSFRNVHCRHVLEHLHDPLGFLKELRRVLRKGGRLVLLTDQDNRNFWDDYTHVRPYSKRSLEQLAFDAGFRISDIYPFPSRGVPLTSLLFRSRILNPSALMAIYRAYARVAEGNSIILDAINGKKFKQG